MVRPSPTLSVMMANYNHARFIPTALDAILSQSFQPTEIVIIDDGSTDDSVQVLERYRNAHPDVIKLILNPKNLGLLPNMQRLSAMAQAEFIVVPAFDDTIRPGFFERSVGLLSKHPSAGLCSTLSAIQDEDGRLTGLVRMPIVLPVEGLLSPVACAEAYERSGNWFMGNTVIFRRQALINAGGYREDLGPYADGFVSLVIALQDGVCFIPEPLAVWRRMDGTFSHVASANLSGTTRVLKRAEHLMRHDYRHLFTPSFIDEWKKEMYFGALSHVAMSGIDGLRQVRAHLAGESAFDGVFFVLARMWPAAARRLIKPYLFVRFRRTHFWTMVKRRMWHLRRSHRPA